MQVESGSVGKNTHMQDTSTTLKNLFIFISVNHFTPYLYALELTFRLQMKMDDSSIQGKMEIEEKEEKVPHLLVSRMPLVSADKEPLARLFGRPLLWPVLQVRRAAGYPLNLG